MDSLTDLREVVDVVIGVDTHVNTHSAAVVDTATGGVVDEVTVEATAQGYAELVEFANPTRRCGPGPSKGPAGTAPV
jgi:transposase